MKNKDNNDLLRFWESLLNVSLGETIANQVTFVKATIPGDTLTAIYL